MTVLWRDVRTDPPTKEDGDHRGKVFQMLQDGSTGMHRWNNLLNTVAWFPTKDLPEFVPKPGPPPGYRYIVRGEAFDERRKLWEGSRQEWIAGSLPQYSLNDTYVVPIEPAEPQYQAFKGATEFDPYSEMRWRFKGDPPELRRMPADYSNKLHGSYSWQSSFDNKVFCNDTPQGLPFGVLIQ